MLHLRGVDRHFHVPQDLVQLGPSRAPVVSAYLGRTGDRRVTTDESLTVVRELSQVGQLALQHGRSRESFEADLDRVRAHLEQSSDDARGLAIFSCTAVGLWRVLALATPPPPLMHVGPHPALLPLVEAVQDSPPTLVALGDTISLRLIALEHPQPRELRMPAGRIRRVASLSRQLGRRRDVRREPHGVGGAGARAAARAIALAAGSHRFAHLVIAGEHTWRSALMDGLSPEMRARLRAEAPLDARAPLDEVAERVWPAVQEQAARERDRAVAAVASRVDERRRAVSGAARVSECLSAGRVETLVIDAAIVEPARAEVFVRHALAHRARVLIVRDEPQLGNREGLVATLR